MIVEIILGRGGSVSGFPFLNIYMYYTNYSFVKHMDIAICVFFKKVFFTQMLFLSFPALSTLLCPM